MSDSTLPASEPNSLSTLLEEPGVLVAKKHHLLAVESLVESAYTSRLIASGISIYWASPSINQPDPNTGNVDVAADIGIWMCSHVPDCILQQPT